MRIIVAGSLARDPLGGSMSWRLSYLLGLQELGHDVCFLEESGETPYFFDVRTMEEGEDPERAAGIVERTLTQFEFGGRWVYRAGESCLGMSHDEIVDLCGETDVLLALATDVWGWQPEYDRIQVRIFIDADPGFTQFRAAAGDWNLAGTLSHCNRFFGYGRGIGENGSPIPSLGRRWRHTVPPVVLSRWPVTGHDDGAPFTTVMSWSADPSPIYDGETYGQKDVEFERILDLPRQTSQALEVAMTGGPAECLREHGWRVVPGWCATRDVETYRTYIGSARGEVSVAKNGYVKTGCGWVSDRTACFLASGKPAIVQETGASRWLPVGEGLLTFRDLEGARAAIDAVNAEYGRHCVAARRLAETYFDSRTVLSRLLDEAEIGA